MKRGFYTIMAAQFFSSLADNMLLIAAIKMLLLLEGPEWLTPLLKFFFTISYVVLAPFVGAFADSMPKGNVMFATNTVKIAGCLLIFFSADLVIPGIAPHWLVLVAYAIVGLGAADRIVGGRGNDRIDGGPGADDVSGGRGADLVTGGGSEDHVEGGPNRDAVMGDAGSDVVQGGRGRDFCVATDDGIGGNDVANGGPGRDVYDADPGDVLVSVETARDC